MVPETARSQAAIGRGGKFRSVIAILSSVLIFRACISWDAGPLSGAYGKLAWTQHLTRQPFDRRRHMAQAVRALQTLIQSTLKRFGAKLLSWRRSLTGCSREVETAMRKHTATSHGFILGTWVKSIVRALDAAGCNGSALLAEAGFDLKALDGPNARCTLPKTARLWRLALAATGDAAFGLKVASHIKHTTFHALGYGLSASSTLKEAFERVQRY